MRESTGIQAISGRVVVKQRKRHPTARGHENDGEEKTRKVGWATHPPFQLTAWFIWLLVCTRALAHRGHRKHWRRRGIAFFLLSRKAWRFGKVRPSSVDARFWLLRVNVKIKYKILKFTHHARALLTRAISLPPFLPFLGLPWRCTESVLSRRTSARFFPFAAAVATNLRLHNEHCLIVWR